MLVETKLKFDIFLRNHQNQSSKTKDQLQLTPWWLNVAYLESRDPLPVVTSPGVNFPKFEYQVRWGPEHEMG